MVVGEDSKGNGLPSWDLEEGNVMAASWSLGLILRFWGECGQCSRLLDSQKALLENGHVFSSSGPGQQAVFYLLLMPQILPLQPHCRGWGTYLALTGAVAHPGFLGWVGVENVFCKDLATRREGGGYFIQGPTSVSSLEV